MSRMTRRIVIGTALAAIAAATVLIVVERHFTRLDEARATAGETFANVGAAHIRYRMRGKSRPAVVFLAGMGASIASKALARASD